MKKYIFFLLFTFVGTGLFAQEKFNLYNPDADAKQQIADAVKKAQTENKNIFLQIGGNWCVWCFYFHNLTEENAEINEYINQNFVVIQINHSKENKNSDVLASLDYPQRFGFPVFVILDQNGKRIHTQNSAYLEEGKGHSPKKVMEFLKHWSPLAINPDSYKE